ncbi:MAG: lipoyl(octanoyl) transferase LipB [Chloroflexi bacterium]|nr:lipoyl(octanoyl) transferase LipB [Chloroflexota bacterium]
MCVVHQLGRIEYHRAFELQKELLQQRLKGQIADTLLLLEHPPTITVGKLGKLENVLASPAQLASAGVSLIFTDRGGDVTYHGPGQIVGYPILDLRERNRDIHQYVHNLEEVLIRTLADYGIKSGRGYNHAGVWVNDMEIAALGLSIRKWITMHGFALNVNTDLDHFTLINPCGFTNKTATSIAHLLGHELPRDGVTERLLAHFAEVFEVELEFADDYTDENYYERKTATLV